MPAELANDAAAVAAGYTSTVFDRGSDAGGPRFVRYYRKRVTNEPGRSYVTIEAVGNGVDQATADANALSALNKQRDHRYGGAPGRADADASSPGPDGSSLTTDVS